MSGAAPAPRSQPEKQWLRDLVPLRPQGPVELIDRATQIMRTRIRDLATITLGVNLPVWLLLAAVLRGEWARGLNDNPQWFLSSLLPEPFLLATAGSGTHGSTWAFVLGRGLPSLGLAVTGAAAGTLLANWGAGRPMTGAEALVRVARRGHRVLLLWGAIHLLLLVSVVGLFLGPLAFGIAMPLWAIEETTTFSAIRRSWALSAKQLGRVFLTVVLATGLSLLVGVLLSAVPLLALFVVGSNWTDLGGTGLVALTGAIPHLVIDPLLAMSMALLALDLKVRVEGADLTAELDELHHVQA